MSTTEQLIQLASERFNLDAAAVGPDDDFFETLGIDSLQALDFLSELEIEFDVEIPDYELQGVNTLRALAAEIDKRR